jgi:hypothetical protein
MRDVCERLLRDERGVGVVGLMLVLSLLAIFALVAAGLAVDERRTASLDSVHHRSLMAADSGSEAAIAWLQMRDRPPAVQDIATGKVMDSGASAMLVGNDQGFEFDVSIRRDPLTGNYLLRPRPGYDPERFLDFTYDIDAAGEAGREGSSDVSVIATKLTPVNYN